MNYPMTQQHNYDIFRGGKWHSDDVGLRSPVIQMFCWRKCATFIVERVGCPSTLPAFLLLEGDSSEVNLPVGRE